MDRKDGGDPRLQARAEINPRLDKVREALESWRRKPAARIFSAAASRHPRAKRSGDLESQRRWLTSISLECSDSRLPSGPMKAIRRRLVAPGRAEGNAGGDDDALTGLRKTLATGDASRRGRTISSMLCASSVTTQCRPQTIESRRAVLRTGESAMIGTPAARARRARRSSPTTCSRRSRRARASRRSAAPRR